MPFVILRPGLPRLALSAYRMLAPSLRRVALFLAGLLAAALPAAAQPANLSGFPLLRIEPSARAAALGGAFSAVYGDDVNALFYNPALLNGAMHRTLSVSYLNHLTDLNAGFAAYAQEVGAATSVGGGLRYLSYGELERAAADGQAEGTFGAAEAALTVGAARAYGEHVRYGLATHLVLATLDDRSASALAADLGVVLLVPTQQLTLSASVNNLGVTLSSLGTTRDALPLDVRLSIAKRLQYLPLLLSATGYNLQAIGSEQNPEARSAADEVMQHLALGGEFQFSEAFNVRFGYNHRRHQQLKMGSRLDLAGFGVGFGLKVSRVRLDYAFNSWSSLGGLHQLTVRTRL